MRNTGLLDSSTSSASNNRFATNIIQSFNIHSTSTNSCSIHCQSCITSLHSLYKKGLNLISKVYKQCRNSRFVYKGRKYKICTQGVERNFSKKINLGFSRREHFMWSLEPSSIGKQHWWKELDRNYGDLLERIKKLNRTLKVTLLNHQPGYAT